MKKLILLKALLVLQTFVLLVYTYFVFRNEGANLFQIVLFNIQSVSWNGQFNLDFSSYLLLSGLWIVWRNEYSVYSISFAAIAMLIGIMAFAPYILFLLIKEKGDLTKVMVGDRK